MKTLIRLLLHAVIHFFLIFALNIDCGYSLELPQGGGSNMYPQFMFKSKNKKNITIFHQKIIIFTALKNLSILHGHFIVLMFSNS